MLFKLSYKNIKKSFKDYTIYFLTLMLGVAIFYVFNSLDSQQAMMKMSASTREIVDLMLNLLAGVSIFVSFILGFLIIYANRFLIRRRKKEFGIYMTLGMGKRQITKILLIETFLVGIFSLVIGLIIGIFGSQLMSVLVANLFDANMTEYQFIFSQEAAVKTIVYFAIIYVFVMFLNLFVTSRYKLIDLLTAGKKNEKVKFRNPVLSVILFIVSLITLGIAYYIAITKIIEMDYLEIAKAILLGCIGTFLFFYSLSGFLLKFIQSSKRIYMKNLNMFVLRQVNSQVNTTTFSMTVISILLFLTICIFSSAISLNDSMSKQLAICSPVDITIMKQIDGENVGNKSDIKRLEKAKKTVIEIMDLLGLSIQETFSEYVEANTYQSEEVSIRKTAGEEGFKKLGMKFPNYDTVETLMKVSEYNKIAQMYGNQTIQLAEDEYAIVANFEEMIEIRNMGLESHQTLGINGKTYSPKYTQCVTGSICNSPQPMESGIIILPDSAIQEKWKVTNYFNANYIGTTEEEKQKVEESISKLSDGKGGTNIVNYQIYVNTKIQMYEASKGIGAIVTFIGLYLGIIFLISSAAILALKQLSDSSDNQARYDILRKIGADEKMINGALFKQIAIFYFLPLGLAMFHSIFGIITAEKILTLFGKQDLVGSIITTSIFIILIYGGYFLATYFGSKNIIKEK